MVNVLVDFFMPIFLIVFSVNVQHLNKIQFLLKTKQITKITKLVYFLYIYTKNT